jgi:hypothetical protein
MRRISRGRILPLAAMSNASRGGTRMASRAGCRAASMATDRVTPNESKISQGSRASRSTCTRTKSTDTVRLTPASSVLTSRLLIGRANSHPHRPIKAPSPTNRKKSVLRRCTGGPHDRQLAPAGGCIEGHQAVHQKHAHEQGYEAQEGETELVGPDHAAGRSHLRAEGDRTTTPAGSSGASRVVDERLPRRASA